MNDCPAFVVRILLICTGSPASTIWPSPITIATCPDQTTRSPGSSWSIEGTSAPTVCCAAVRGNCRPASWYDVMVSPLQSRPTPRAVPPQTYGTPSWESALRTALAAVSFGAMTCLPPGRLIATPLPGCGGIATGRRGLWTAPPPPPPPPPSEPPEYPLLLLNDDPTFVEEAAEEDD